MDYLLELGVGAVWLSPVYTSPMRDFGYDVANFTEIDPIFGTMVDFDDLVTALHRKGQGLHRLTYFIISIFRLIQTIGQSGLILITIISIQ